MKFTNLFVSLPASILIFAILVLILDRSLLEKHLPFPEKKRTEEKKAILDTLKLFNAIYSDFHATGGNPSMIDEFPAVKMVKHEIFRDTGFLMNMNRLLVYDMASLTLLDVEFRGSQLADAIVYEEWNYAYQEASSRRPLTEVKGMGNGFRYRLQKAGGKWLVVSWNPVSIKPPEKKDEFVY